MRSSFILYGTIASLILGAGVLTADALSTSDEERLEQLADDLVERDPDERVDAVLAWTDLSRSEVEIQDDGRREHYTDADDAALADDLGHALDGFLEADTDVVQRSVRLEGDRASVAVRVRDADDTMHDVTFRLMRSGQGWLITRLQAH